MSSNAPSPTIVRMRSNPFAIKPLTATTILLVLSAVVIILNVLTYIVYHIARNPIEKEYEQPINAEKKDKYTSNKRPYHKAVNTLLAGSSLFVLIEILIFMWQTWTEAKINKRLAQIEALKANEVTN